MFEVLAYCSFRFVLLDINGSPADVASRISFRVCFLLFNGSVVA